MSDRTRTVGGDSRSRVGDCPCGIATILDDGIGVRGADAFCLVKPLSSTVSVTSLVRSPHFRLADFARALPRGAMSVSLAGPDGDTASRALLIFAVSAASDGNRWPVTSTARGRKQAFSPLSL